MKNFPFCDPNMWIAHELRMAACHLLSWKIGLSGIAYDNINHEKGIPWKITVVQKEVYKDMAQCSLLKRGVWVNIGSFEIHEACIDAMMEFMDLEIFKAFQELKTPNKGE